MHQWGGRWPLYGTHGTSFKRAAGLGCYSTEQAKGLTWSERATGTADNGKAGADRGKSAHTLSNTCKEIARNTLSDPCAKPNGSEGWTTICEKACQSQAFIALGQSAACKVQAHGALFICACGECWRSYQWAIPFIHRLPSLNVEHSSCQLCGMVLRSNGGAQLYCQLWSKSCGPAPRQVASAYCKVLYTQAKIFHLVNMSKLFFLKKRCVIINNPNMGLDTARTLVRW